MTAQRIDLYSLIHKVARKRLFDVSVLAGRTDLADPRSAAAFRSEFDALAAWLRAHAQHEERFIHPLLAARAPDDREALAREHHEGEADLERFERELEGLVRGDSDRDARRRRAVAFYRGLNRFVSSYLTHLDDEETRAMPRLWALYTDAELEGVMQAFTASRTAAEAMGDLASMLPVLAPSERVMVMAPMKSGLPEASFRAACEVAAGVLAPDEWAALERALG